jgi:O-antigen ligase
MLGRDRLWFKPDRSALGWVLLQLLLGSTLALLIALVPLPTLALLLLGSGVALFALSDPVFAVAAAILSVPFQELVQLPAGLSVTQACLLLALASLALRALLYPERRLPLGPLFWPLAIFIWWLGVSASFTPFSQIEAFRETLRWSTVLLIYLLTLAALPADPAVPAYSWRTLLLVACLLLAPASNALLGIAQFLTGAGPESFAIGGGRARAFGTIGQPNSFAAYMNQVWPLAVGVSLAAGVQLVRLPWRQWRHERLLSISLIIAGTTALLTMGALIASFSRGGWVGALAGGLVLLVAMLVRLEPTIRRSGFRLLVGAGLLGVLVVALGGSGLLPASLAQRLNSITANLRLFDVRGVVVTPDNFAVVERMAHLQAGWNMLNLRPLLGVGPGNYSIVFEQTPTLTTSSVTVRPWLISQGHAHNYYLHIAAETGLIGAAAYLLLMGTVALQAWRAVQYAQDWFAQGIAWGGAGVLAAVGVHNLFENVHVLNMGLQLGTIWALIIWVSMRRVKAGQ